MSKKKKFDLSNLVHEGYLKDGDTVYFVSNPGLCAMVSKQPNGEFKLRQGTETLTVHAFAQKCLGTEPPDHASKWLRTVNNKTLYELWHADDELKYAA